MQRDLFQAIQDAREQNNRARVLRLFIANLPRTPQSGALRLLFERVEADRLGPEERERVIRASLAASIDDGDALAAVAAIRSLEAMDVAAGEAWDDLFLALEARGIAAAALRSPTPPLDLSAERPDLPEDALRAVALELVCAARDAAAEPPAADPFRHVPVLSQLTPARQRWLLLRLALREPLDGEPIVAGRFAVAGFLLWGELASDDEALAHDLPAVVVAGEAEDLAAHRPCLLLVPRGDAEDELADEPDLALGVQELRDRRALLRQLARSGAVEAFQSMQPAATSALRVVRVEPGELLAGDDAAYAMSLTGTFTFGARNANPVPITPGEWVRMRRADEVRATSRGSVVLIHRTNLSQLSPPLLDWFDRNTLGVESSTAAVRGDLSSIELGDEDLL